MTARLKGFGLALAAIPGACDASSEITVDREAEQVATSIPQAYLDLLGPTSNVPLPRSRDRSAPLAVCSDSTALAELFPGRGIFSVLRETPFRFQPAASSSTCHVRIVEKVPRESGSSLFKYKYCDIEIHNDGSVLIGKNEIDSIDQKLPMAECFYRYGLYYLGYQGAFSAGNFENSGDIAYFAGSPWVGSRATWVAVDILYKCPEASNYYYTNDLMRSVITNCAQALNRKGY